ncbi:larval cuticle protein A2B-like [Periplaneta americana]|uniref:larval cuticle protein A2B-like n=1 Tax=Periplaneta americana TaxID=6978 RepID=UPI0037E780FE
MACTKLVVLAALLVGAQSVYIGHPVAHHPGAIIDDFDPHPEYSYSYSVHDPITGDTKGQHETRSGDVVQGSYSLVDPDGTTRTVDYTADPVNGFNAVVNRQPGAVAAPVPVPAAVRPVAARAYYAAPYSAPYAYPHYAYPHYAAPAYRAHAAFTSPHASYIA